MSAVPKTILAATDFSETAETAARLARDLAARFEARLHMLHVVVLLEDPHLEESHRLQLEALVATADKTRREVLEHEVGEEPGVEVVPHLVRGIAPGETIVEVAANAEADLIVMGTHGRRGLSHLLLGSVAERVVRTASAPVLTVRSDAEINTGGISRILVPHDFSDASAEAVRTAAAWATSLGAKITLLHVVEPVVYPEFYSMDTISDDLMRRLVSRSEEALQRVQDDLGVQPAVNTRVEIGRAADTIVAVAEPEEFDLLVMATRGLSGIEHVLLGSVAEAVLRRCRIPMLTVPGRS
jgi:nucleotide-binding universal stress UspA family protein